MEVMLRQQCEYVGRQLLAAQRGMKDTNLDARPIPTGMTVRETMIHLCDVYRYVIEKVAGGDPKWDQYTGSGSPEEFGRLRDEAIEASFSTSDPFEWITDYIIVHDAYHVGQLCCIRKACEPEWDSHSIYGAQE